MTKWFSARIAAYGLVIFLSLFLVVHLLILTGVIPFTMVWGGRLKTHTEMVISELLGLAINFLLLLVVANYAGLVRLWKGRQPGQVFFWLLAGIFLLNTLGNLFSESKLEQLLFTPITVLLVLFSLRLALEKRSPKIYY